MEIRPAKSQDIPALCALLNQIAALHSELRPDLFRTETQKYSQDALAAMLDNAEKPIFVAEEAGNVIGHLFCSLRDYGAEGVFLPHRTLYIDDFCVDDKYRGRGVGTQLYQYAKTFAEANSCYNLTLNVWTANQSAYDFYIACGMQPQRCFMETIL